MRRRTFAKSLLIAGVAPAALARRSFAAAAARKGFDYDVAVVGAGVFGAWTAWHLARAGRKVVLLDAYGPGHTRASSGDETRIMRMAYGENELYTRWAVRALSFWKQLQHQSDRELFLPTGVLHFGTGDDRYALDSMPVLKRARVPFELLSLVDIEKRFPQVGPGYLTFALHEPEAGVLMARRGVMATVDEARRAGAAYLSAAAQPPEGRDRLDTLVTQDGRRIRAREFVFACGPWLPKLFPDVVGGLINVIRAQVFFIGVPPGNPSFGPNALPAWTDSSPAAYGVPDIEARGVKIGIDPDEEAIDPDTGERQVTSEGLAAAQYYASLRFPGLRESPVVETRVCQYENTQSGEFLIDRHPDLEDVWIVGGGSGHGFKHGPAVGEYLAARVMNPKLALDPRFSLRSHRAAPSTSVR